MIISNQSESPSHDEIAVLAHQLWEINGRPDGRDVEFWFQAENQLRPSRSKLQPQAAAKISQSIQARRGKGLLAKAPRLRANRPASRPFKGELGLLKQQAEN
jgi:hypothetical protein